jgi:hypothetical protein
VRAAVALVAGLVLVSSASAGDSALLAVKARYLPPAQRAFPPGPDGLQARYDAGRDLEEALRGLRVSTGCRGLRRALVAFARAQIATAEAADFPGTRSAPGLPHVPAGCGRLGTPGTAPGAVAPRDLALPAGAQVARPEDGRDDQLSARLAAIGRSYRGWAGFWVHDLRTGRVAGWNADAVFPAGSAVKLGPLLASLSSASLSYDAAQIGAWSSNLAANRITEKLGTTRVDDALRRLGMWSSTYPGLYRAGTTAAFDSPKPPPVTHSRVTTAHDLGRALYRLHAAAIGNRLALSQLAASRAQARHALALLLASTPVGNNIGLLRPWLPQTTMAQKNAWISDLRTTAAVVYAPTGPVIVVVEVSRPGLTSVEARTIGRQVVRAVGF